MTNINTKESIRFITKKTNFALLSLVFIVFSFLFFPLISSQTSVNNFTKGQVVYNPEIPTQVNNTYNNTYINQTVNATVNSTQFTSNNPIHINESWLHNFIDSIISGFNYITGAEVPSYETDPTIPATPENPTQKFLNGNKEWTAVAVGGGSYASNIYFTTYNSSVAGYKNLSYTVEPNETIYAYPMTSGEYLMHTYLYTSPIGTDIIDGGVWIFNYRVKVSNAMTGNTYIKVQPFIRLTNGTEINLFNYTSDKITNTDYEDLRASYIQPAYNINSTGTFGIRLYANTTSSASVTLSTVVGDGHGSYFDIPIRLRHSQLRELNEDPNYLHYSNTGNITTTGNVSANYFYGNGSQLTDLPITEVNLSGYVPYTGATGDVDLGSHQLTSTGNVGIGTTNPGVKLDVSGQARFQSTVFPVVDIIRNTTSDGAFIYGGAKLERLTTSPTNNGGIGFYFKYPDSTGASTFAGMFGGALSTITNGAEVGDIVFGAAWKGADPFSNQHLIIRATGATTGNVLVPNGNVGIGTTAPGAKLDVELSSAMKALRLDANNYDDGTAIFSIEGIAVNASVDYGKAFQFIQNGENYARGAFYGDGAYGIGGGAAARDVYIRRYSANNLMVDSNKAGGAANLLITGNVGVGLKLATPPTARLHIAAGTATAGTAPLKLTSGTLLGTAEVGAVEFLTDKFYGTITTGASRKEFTLNDASLTSGRIPFVTTNGRLKDDVSLTYDTTQGLTSTKNFTIANLTTTGINVTGLIYGNGSQLTGIPTTSPSNPNQSVQFNWNGAFGGTADFTFNNLTKYLKLTDNTKLSLGSDDDALLYDDGSNIIFKGSNSVENLPSAWTNTLFLQGIQNIFWNDSTDGGGIFSGNTFLARTNFNTRFDAQSAGSLTNLNNFNTYSVNNMPVANTSFNNTTKVVSWDNSIPNTNGDVYGTPIKLVKGWNMFTISNLASNPTDRRNVTITINPNGLTLAGYSSEVSTSIYNSFVTYSNGSNVSFELAYANGDISFPKKAYPDTTSVSPPQGNNPVIILEQNQAYWFTAKNVTSITFKGVGGSNASDSYNVYNLLVKYNNTYYTYEDAYWILRIIGDSFFEWSPNFLGAYQFNTVEDLSPWKGYMVRSYVDNIELYVQEKNLTNYTLQMNYKSINSVNKYPNNITYSLNGGNFTMGNDGLNGNYTNGNCWTRFRTGVAINTNCTSL